MDLLSVLVSHGGSVDAPGSEGPLPALFSVVLVRFLTTEQLQLLVLAGLLQFYWFIDNSFGSGPEQIDWAADGSETEGGPVLTRLGLTVFCCVPVLLQPAGDLLCGAGLCSLDLRRGEEPSRFQNHRSAEPDQNLRTMVLERLSVRTFWSALIVLDKTCKVKLSHPNQASPNRTGV